MQTDSTTPNIVGPTKLTEPHRNISRKIYLIVAILYILYSFARSVELSLVGKNTREASKGVQNKMTLSNFNVPRKPYL